MKVQLQTHLTDLRQTKVQLQDRLTDVRQTKVQLQDRLKDFPSNESAIAGSFDGCPSNESAIAGSFDGRALALPWSQGQRAQEHGRGLSGTSGPGPGAQGGQRWKGRQGPRGH